ncbi:MAG: PQQ-dependent dehydrogenase, methanol/ethanol family [Gammaproteobacteria bacterium]|jgi:quinohemoprotein ethanol dehydrogenase|nr:PQQ-dependent dehydrogenase, methanol/ethanol family [Gammaproteobacteria bacterium]
MKLVISYSKVFLFTTIFLSSVTPGSLLAADKKPLSSASEQRLLSAENEPENWMMYGRTYKEQRYSPLQQINDKNVSKLNLEWYADIPSINGFSSTPLVIDGTIYLTGSFANVFAIDTREGNVKWHYNPGVSPDGSLASAWASRINRGVAFWEDKLYLATGDCRLIALDAKSGREIWVNEACDSSKQYSMNGAPRVANGKVYIGNSLSDLGARGFIAAYDAKTGKRVWQFWTVPNHPSLGKYENKAMAMAGLTWTGGGAKYGGAAVWESIVYDAEFNSILFGTDSAAPLNAEERNPDGGDNLFTNSIVAVDADSGEYKWHYQAVPNDAWDYNSNMPIILADLEIEGRMRKVAMHAPKNGFFFLIDRTNGEFISANNFVPVNWASHYDSKTGRPVELPGARFYQNNDGQALIYPGILGAHNWHSMSYNPETGLVYFGAMDTGAIIATKKDALLGGVFVDNYASGTDIKTLYGRGSLIAWDPKRQFARWRRPHKLPLNGGVLSTKGNLVFQGTATGHLQAYSADAGQLLWQYKTSSAIHAAPISYQHKGRQIILVPIGASAGLSNAIPKYAVDKKATGPSRLLAFSLDGKNELPEPVPLEPYNRPQTQFASAAILKKGATLFNTAFCWGCHAQRATSFGGSAPDLRRSPMLMSDEAWYQVVVKGVKRANGMLGEPSLSREDSESLRAYVLEQAWKAYNEQEIR